MIDGLTILAALIGMAGALYGSRPAYPLLISLGVYNALPTLGFYFDPLFWFGVDAVVIVAVALIDRVDARTVAIVTLFLPAWGFYFTEPEVRYVGTLAVVVLQMVMTLPLSAFPKRRAVRV